MFFKTIFRLSALFLALAASETLPVHAGEIITVYTTRSSGTDASVLHKFSRDTGIAVCVVSGKPDELISRLRDEAPAAKADVFITVDGGVLDSAKEAGVLQPVSARGDTGQCARLTA